MAKNKAKKKSSAAKKTPLKKTSVKKAAKKPARLAKKASQSSGKKVAVKKAAAQKATPRKTNLKKQMSSKAASNKAASRPTGPSQATNQNKPKQKINWAEFVTPLDDRILIQLNEMERRTPGGLFIPDTVSDVSGNLRGSVVAVGRGHRDKFGRLKPMDVQIGDHVLFSEHAGSKIDLLGETVILIRESEVMGVLTS